MPHSAVALRAGRTAAAEALMTDVVLLARDVADDAAVQGKLDLKEAA